MIWIWRTEYVPEGQIEPDKFNRWAMVGSLLINREGLKHLYPPGLLNDISRSTVRPGIPIDVVRISQRGTLPGDVPSIVHQFAAKVPWVGECLNGGVTFQTVRLR